MFARSTTHKFYHAGLAYRAGELTRHIAFRDGSENFFDTVEIFVYVFG
jgi:hypothetical protein